METLMQLAAVAFGAFYSWIKKMAVSGNMTGKFRLNRILVWLNPEKYIDDKGYQTVQALYAIGSGGLFGKGLGKSLQKLGYIPESQNDMIFSVICEELGLFGAFCLIALFIVMLWRIRNQDRRTLRRLRRRGDRMPELPRRREPSRFPVAAAQTRRTLLPEDRLPVWHLLGCPGKTKIPATCSRDFSYKNPA